MDRENQATPVMDVAIHTEYIQLDQLLKLADVISTGGQVKFFIDDERIYLNGALVHEKRKKIRPGDVVLVKEACEIHVLQERT